MHGRQDIRIIAAFAAVYLIPAIVASVALITTGGARERNENA